MQIVGIVRDAISQSLRAPPPPAVYVPFFKLPTEFPTIEVYASGSLAQIASTVRRELQPKFPGVPVQIHTLTAQVESALIQERLMAALAVGFGGVALILAMVGLYGLLTYTVTRRTTELGVRMALGADALRLIAAGVIVGLPAAWTASRLISSMLFGVTPIDTATAIAAASLLFAAGIVAALLPARRAATIDPMVALRTE